MFLVSCWFRYPKPYDKIDIIEFGSTHAGQVAGHPAMTINRPCCTQSTEQLSSVKMQSSQIILLNLIDLRQK